MGLKAEEALEIKTVDEVASFLRANTRVFMDVDGAGYYLTHTDGYWRAQDCAVLNDKGHFTDCSELALTLSEFMTMPWLDGKSVADLAEDAVFYRSIQED